MRKIWIEATENTPKIVLDKDHGVFEIKGKSTIELAQEFYSDILNWMDEYVENPNAETTFNFYLHSFNITSSKRILFILYKLDSLVEQGYDVKVNWLHDEHDEDMLEVGHDYAFMVKVPFNILAQVKEPVLA